MSAECRVLPLEPERWVDQSDDEDEQCEAQRARGDPPAAAIRPWPEWAVPPVLTARAVGGRSRRQRADAQAREQGHARACPSRSTEEASRRSSSRKVETTPQTAGSGLCACYLPQP